MTIANNLAGLVNSSENLQVNSGYGSAATAYGCRAWVNFNGTGTVAIRGSGNVSSITDNGTGDYTVNFTTAMPDTNYSVAGMVANLNGGLPIMIKSGGVGGAPTTMSTSACRIIVNYGTLDQYYDAQVVGLSFHR